MARAAIVTRPKVGDEVAVARPGHSSASPNLRGEIVDVRGDPGRELCRVRWKDGTETVLPAGAASRVAPRRRTHDSGRIRILGSPTNEGSAGLVGCWRRHGLPAEFVTGREALATARPGDVVLGRLDVLPTLDGVEPGLVPLLLLERRGVRVLNPVRGLLAAHDKLRTARLLERARVPHPRTAPLVRGQDPAHFPTPCVVKPRFGSWGRDVFRCDSDADLARCLRELEERPWFRRHGAIVQELVSKSPRDLRVIVAAGRVVGAAERLAAPGEWRTNVSLGGSSRPTRPPEDAAELARTAAAVVGMDLVGVDMLPTTDGGYVVLELNGAVDFDDRYSLGETSVYLDVANALRLTE